VNSPVPVDDDSPSVREASPARHREALSVFGPSLVLTITIEAGPERPSVHLHAGGQGFWVARLAATLGADVTLCCALGGEPGLVLRSLIEAEPIKLKAAPTSAPNGVYIHDRRSGERVEIVNVDGVPLDRHGSDALYGMAVAAGLDAEVTLLTGCHPADLISPDLYRRLVRDLRANDKVAVADLTGPPLRAALEGGVDLLKLSQEELVAEGYAQTSALDDLISGARRLRSQGARHVLVSRAEEAAVLVSDESSDVALSPPPFEPVDAHGTGDSMFAATAVGIARGMSTIDALRMGMAAGALNATRRGLGTGTREEIERLAAHVSVGPVGATAAD
jgi:1-phosphofructokinase